MKALYQCILFVILMKIQGCGQSVWLSHFIEIQFYNL